MVIQEKLLTVEEFWERYEGQPYELINGEVVEVSPAGGESPEVGAIMGSAITPFVMRNRLGKVTNAEGGYYISPFMLLAPDFAFYTWDKHKLHKDRKGFRPFPPDLAFEVVSSSDRASDIEKKVGLYLDAGVRLLWIVYPETRTVMVFKPDAQPQRLTINDTLTGDDVLPGFVLKVADCFPPEPPDEEIEA